MSEIFSDKFRQLQYLYDFGDSWLHEITLEAITDDKQANAICLKGGGACPPEDCGGSYGYEEMKYAFAMAPDSDETNNYREWLGLSPVNGKIDTTTFDIDKANKRLIRIEL